MWGSFLASSEAAKERIAAALEKTGEVLTQTATAHARRTAAASDTKATRATGPAPSSTTQSVGKDESSSTDDADRTSKPEKVEPERQEQAMLLDSLRLGWGSVMEATKHAVDATREAVEKEQNRLFRKGPFRRDPSLPLDVEALRDAEVVYITDRLITLGHPAMQSSTNRDITPERKLAAVGHLLQRRHDGRYMVWNMSELDYDFSVLDDQVLTFQFPGSPSPPLGLLLKIILGMESWLNADKRNVAVLHCLTGRGRTSTVLAAFLCWTGEAGFSDPNKALEYIAFSKKCRDVNLLTIPSQRRYASYFSNMLDGVRPSQPPLLLKRIIMSEAPRFGIRPTLLKDDDNNSAADTNENAIVSEEMGCAPYLQIFKAGNLVFTTAAAMSYNQSKEDLPFCVPSDGLISFPIETVVLGDILVRCRHLTVQGQRVSMFRAAFHTGYVPPKVLRLTKAHLDGAELDKRFAADFFIDLIFEACDTSSMSSKHTLSDPDKMENETPVKVVRGGYDLSSEFEIDNVQNEAAARRRMGLVDAPSKNPADGTVSAITITASAYDSMLHRDSRFWDVINERRQQKISKSSTPSVFTEGSAEPANIGYYGPTIGRRREFVLGMKSLTGEGGKDGNGKNLNSKANVEAAGSKIGFEPFSIGGDFDFMGDDYNDTAPNHLPPVSVPAPTGHKKEMLPVTPHPPKKDDLMDALMAIDDESPPTSPSSKRKDVLSDELEHDSGEIVFEMDDDTIEDFSSLQKIEKAAVAPEVEGKVTDKQNDQDTQNALAVQGDEGNISNTVDDTIHSHLQTSTVNTVYDSNKSPLTCDVVKEAENVSFDDLEEGDDDEEDLLGVPLGSGDETFEFDDDNEDDEELEDLENFLTKASSGK